MQIIELKEVMKSDRVGLYEVRVQMEQGKQNGA
jgi:hypothetical protein